MSDHERDNRLDRIGASTNFAHDVRPPATMRRTGDAATARRLSRRRERRDWQAFIRLLVVLERRWRR